MYSKINLFKHSTVLLLLLFAFTKCSEVNDISANETISLEDGTGGTLQITLDPNYKHEGFVFSSDEELDNYLERLEEEANGELILNKSLWNSLHHYLDPFEIAAINNNFQLIIGDDTYRFDYLAVYKLDAADNWKMASFHGETGSVNSEELSMVMAHRDRLELLDNYEFKSPAALIKYQDMKLSIANVRTEDLDEGFFILRKENYIDEDVNNNRRHLVGVNEWEGYEVEYIGRNGSTIVKAITRVNCWNYEFTNPFKRANAGTQLEVMDVSTSNGRYSTTSWITPISATITGSFNGEVVPQVWAKVDVTKDKARSHNGFNVTTDNGRRKKRQKAVSEHRVSFRANGETQRKEIFYIKTTY